MCLQWGPCAATARAYTERATRRWKLPRRLKTDTSQLQHKKPLISSHYSSSWLIDWLTSFRNDSCFDLCACAQFWKGFLLLFLFSWQWSMRSCFFAWGYGPLLLSSGWLSALRSRAFHLKKRPEDFSVSSSSLCKARAELMQAVVL